MVDDLKSMRNIRSFIDTLPGEALPKLPDKLHGETYTDGILPFELYVGKRQNIEKIANQINKSFYHGIYDGTAVLMRRLIETLLLLAFKQIDQEDSIRGPDDNYLPLSKIIDQATQNKQLDLTRNAKQYLRVFQEYGGLSAHNPFYNCTKKDLETVQHKYRSLTEELFYKAGIID